MGMLKKSKDFITYGPVSEETVNKIKDLAGDEVAARLHPPRGGLRSVKRAVGQGGSLGYREDMDALIGRMLP